jgi:hypothetical protein
VKADLHFCFR